MQLSAKAAFSASDVIESHGISLIGDLYYPKNFSHFHYTNPAAPKGGKVTLAEIGTFDSMNPFILRGSPEKNTGLLFDTLLVPAQDEASAAYGLLAHTVRHPSSNEWVEFLLRKEARFSDGTPLTAEDVVFTFTMLTTKGQPHFRAYYRDIIKAEAVDVHRVRFTFAHGNNRELPLIIGEMPILSKVWFDSHDFEKASLVPLLGSGPYMLEKAEPGKFVRYRRNPDYWAKNLPVNKGRYNFDVVQADYYRDASVALQALLAGEYDFRQENISRLWNFAYDSPALSSGKMVKTEIQHEIPQGIQGFFLNTRRSKFADRRVRKALALAFDFAWANEHLFYSAYTRNDSYFENSPLASSGLPDAKELALLEPFRDKVPPSVFDAPFMQPEYHTPAELRQGLLQAKQLLEEAGWKVKNGVLTHQKTGKTFDIEFMLAMPSFERIMAAYGKNLEKLGIKTRIRIVDSAQYVKRMENFDYDMVSFVYPQSFYPGNEQINYWHSSKADTPGSLNFAGIKNPVVDALIEKILAAQNYDQLTTAVRSMDRVLLNEYYAIPCWFSSSFRIAYWDRFGRPETLPKYALGFPETWWWDEAKDKKLGR